VIQILVREVKEHFRLKKQRKESWKEYWKVREKWLAKKRK